MNYVHCTLTPSLNLNSANTTSNNATFTGSSTGTSAASINAILHTAPLTGWSYWQDMYYPQVIRESYPVYLQERSKDKGKQAFEILKQMQDKKLMKLEKVSDFIEAMDTLIKIL